MNAYSAPDALTPVAAAVPIFPWLTRDEVFRVETPRMWLRWARACDAARLQDIASHRSVAEMTATWPHPLPDGEAARRIGSERALNAGGQGLVLALVLKSAPERLIGQIGCTVRATEQLGIGYMLDPTLQGRGLASEAVRGFINVLFSHLRLAQITAAARTINPASRRVLEKNGFVFQRTVASETGVRGPHEVDFLTLSLAQWQADIDRKRRELMLVASQSRPIG